MDFFRESLSAVLRMTLPVGAVTFGLVWWAVQRGHLKGRDGVRGLGKEMKALSNERKKMKKKREKNKKGEALEAPAPKKLDPVQEKWMKFGGGFYGVVALYTYLLVEWQEIVDFVTSFGGLWELVKRISPQAVVGLLLNSIMNFVTAIAWPFYWIQRVHGDWILLWLAAAYAGYLLGARLALHATANDWGFRSLLSRQDRDEEV